MPTPIIKDRTMRAPFVLAATMHGSMILPLNDWQLCSDGTIDIGVGLKILVDGSYDELLMPLMAAVLNQRRKMYGDGVVMIDGGANVGSYAIGLARMMQDWGKILAFEAQERIFYALCGNIAINNAMNVQAFWSALDVADGEIDFPVPNYSTPASYGRVNAAGTAQTGQNIEKRQRVPAKRIDSLGLDRLDFLKIDVEGMELQVLTGALETIKRCKPFMMIEHFHVGLENLKPFFSAIDYELALGPMDVFAASSKDEIQQVLDAYSGVARKAEDQEIS